jgi:transposase
MQDIRLFTSQPKAKFYDDLFLNLDLGCMDTAAARTGRKGYWKAAMLCAFIVMKCEGFSQITDLVDYLENNKLIAYYCGFDITRELPSYWTFNRFLRKLDNGLLKQIMKQQVLKLVKLGIVDTSFIGLDSTPIMANTKLNNPKSFVKNKFSKENQPKNDADCRLGVHTASNQINDKNYEFYWGYKNHVLVDCITGLPIFELTTTANVSDSTVALDILSKTNAFLSVRECTFLADKGYDVKAIYNTVRDTYQGDCVIPLNVRNTKAAKKLPVGNPICEAGLAMHRDGKFKDKGVIRQKFCCPFKRSSHLHDCPCNNEHFRKGVKATGCTKYLSLPDDYRMSIQRDTIEFKSLYSLRSECERYNSRFKSTGQERLWVCSEASASNLNTISHISLLSIALAAVVTHRVTAMRSRKKLKRTA